jgi:hypothetical protein
MSRLCLLQGKKNNVVLSRCVADKVCERAGEEGFDAEQTMAWLWDPGSLLAREWADD